MSAPSKPSPLLLASALFACVAGLGGVGTVVVCIASGYAKAKDEPTVIHLATPEERMAEPGMVSRGQAVFEGQACLGCHGKLLEGGVGPCLTDAVWAKGSSFADIRKSINEGSNEKGMPPFADKLSEDDKIALVAFIKSRAQGLRQVKYDLYEGAWKKLPDFTALKPAESGALKEGDPISIAKFERTGNYGLVFAGKLLVPVGGAHTFRLGSDDGAQLRVDGNLVVDADGLHATTPAKVGSAELKAGEHAFELRYFQATANQGLYLSWEGPVVSGFLTEAPVEPNRVLVKTQVRVVRGNTVGQIGSGTLAIGFPGGVNCVFDCDGFVVSAGWRGDFLDVGGARTGYWQGWNKPLGNAVVLKPEPMLALEGRPEERPVFTGYHIAASNLVVHGRLGGARFDLTLAPAAKGLSAQALFLDPVPGAVVLKDGAGAGARAVRPGTQAQTLEFNF